MTAEAAPRIVSLLPSATEIVYALGLEDRLEGVTDECDWPPAARTKRSVVRALQPAGLSAAEVDAWVREQAPSGGLYALDETAMAAIAPDLVLTQDLCRVCAVPTGDVDAALERAGCPSRVVTLEPQRLDEVIASVATVADAAGVPLRGREVVAALRARLAVVREAVSAFEPVPTLVLEWLDPPYTAGHWVPDVVTAAGGIPLLGEAGGRSREATWDEVRATRPEVTVLAPCGLSPERAWEQAASLPDGVLTDRTVAMDLARPGPRLVDCVEALAAVLHPAAGLVHRPDLAAEPPA
ncbi:MAG TPA: ABC transporter substrate-binding protein [Candidatus Limnocylindrales bacterium]|nr:ABC transporter substrate-binding protein [Candidatus Limnocylindrales bacterium]